MFRGHVISADGIRVNPKNIEAILQRKAPRNVSKVYSFLSLIDYYQIFVNGFLKIVMPTMKLCKRMSSLFGMNNVTRVSRS